MSDENTVVVEGGVDSGGGEPQGWDGTYDTLEKQSWYATIPEKDRAHFQGWHEAQAQLEFFRKLADSDPDKAAYLQEREADRAKLADLERQLAEAGQSKAELAAVQAKITEEKVMQEFKTLRETFPDIVDHENDKVFDKFMDLLDAGETQEDAAAMVRAKFKIAPGTPATRAGGDIAQPANATEAPANAVTPSKSRVVTVPKSEQAMNATSNTPRPEKGGKYRGMKWDEAKVAAAKDIEAEENDA